MPRSGRILLLCALAIALTLTGCPATGTAVETAVITASADLSPAYDAGINVAAVSVSLTGTITPLSFDLAVDPQAQSATGTATAVPHGDYTVTVRVSDTEGIVGQASGSLAVRADATIAVTIAITVNPETSGGSFEVDLQ